MKYKSVALYALAATMAMAPVSSAFARDHNHWGHGGPLVGLIALGTVAAVGVATILTAPINAMAAAAPQPQPYYAPPPPQGYYAQQAPVYYNQPPVMYGAPVAYYAPAPVYYGAPRYYYR